jgi:bifunctional DNA-binding transcriptional regulator/antitoxin component of YhaV-PrlF toxin-antitoxin module
MVTKLQRTEQGIVVLLPEDILEQLGLDAETEVSITVRPEQGQIVISLADEALPGVDEEFARQVSDFIQQYRPALEALAR